MFDKIADIIVENLGVEREEVTPDATLMDDLGADSLDAVEISMAIADELDIEIEDEDFEQFKTVQDIVDYVEAKTE